MADIGLQLLLFVLAVLALPAVVVWALVDADAAAKVGVVTVVIAFSAAVVILSAGTKYSGDW